MNFSNFLQTTHPLQKQGTRLPVGNSVYEFRQNAVGDFVCEVLSAKDRAAILSISGAYQPYVPSEDKAETLARAMAGVPGIDRGELSKAMQDNAAANRAAGAVATATAAHPPQQPESARARARQQAQAPAATASADAGQPATQDTAQPAAA